MTGDWRLVRILQFHNSTLPQFNSSTLTQFNAFTIQQFNNSTVQQSPETVIRSATKSRAPNIQQFNNSTVQRFNSSFVCSMETADCRLFPKYILAAGLSGRHRPYYPRSAIYRYGSICSAGFDNLSLCFGLFPLFCLCRCNASGCR